MSEIPDKHSYKMGEVCKFTDTQPYVLRFWESEFPQLAPQKNRGGQRLYRREDLEMVLRIKQLLYEQEYTIADARRVLEQESLPEGGTSLRSSAANGDADSAGTPGGGEPGTSEQRISKPAGVAEEDLSAAWERPLPDDVRMGIQRLRRELAEADERLRSIEVARAEAEEGRHQARERCREVASALEGLLRSLGVEPSGPEPYDANEGASRSEAVDSAGASTEK